MFDVGGKTWKSYNWSMVTTLAMFGKYDAELVCYAHSKGARVVLKGTFLPLHFFQVSEGRSKTSTLEHVSFSTLLSLLA